MEEAKLCDDEDDHDDDDDDDHDYEDETENRAAFISSQSWKWRLEGWMVRRLEGWRMTLHGDVDDSGADAAKHNKKLIDAVNMKLLKLCGKSEIRTES